MIIVDHEGQLLEDIPSFFLSMLPDTIERYEYNNLRNGRCYKYHRDCSDNASVEICDPTTNNYLKFSDYRTVKVYGEIVAGNPLETSKEIDGSFDIPQEWLIEPKQTFLLRVTGDSMKDAGINIGDYVLINKQSYADNNQIIVATLGMESTLKTYRSMGGNVLLIPENKAYEPIMIKPDELIINGVVIGVLKK